MRWALAFHPDHIKHLPNGRNRLMVAPMDIPEDRIPGARRQGWIVLGADSDIYPAADMNLHSNPRRVAEDGDGA